MPESTSTSAPDSTVQPQRSTTLPVAANPCAAPAEHQVGNGPTEYTFAFDGADRPVGVIVGSDALTESSVLWVVLHGASLGWRDHPYVTAGIADLIGPAESRIIVAAQATPSLPSFWSQSETFNADYLSTLFEQLSASFCLDRADVILAGIGQGTLAAAQAICTVDLPVDAAYLTFGMVKMDVCEPTRAVPILTVDLFEYDPQYGNHWDGSWNPPPAVEVELTGGIDATPDDAAVWAEVYNCTSGPTTETIPDEREVLERDSTVLAYRSCDAPIVAFGLENAASGVSPVALAETRPLIASELREFVDR